MSLTRKVRRGLDLGARSVGLLSWMEARMRRGLTVLMYHRVLPEERCGRYPFPSLVMPEPFFARQMEWLAARCEVLPVHQALARLAAGARSPRPLVAVTFDDGYADNCELAAPILERNGLRGTFFVTTDFVGSGALLWFDRAALLLAEGLPEVAHARATAHGLSVAGLPDPRANPGPWLEALKRAAPVSRAAFLADLEAERGGPPPLEGFEPLSREQVRDLHRRGHEVGSHTLGHPLLPLLEAGQLEREVAGSRAVLESWLAAPVAGFCYPNGDHDPRSLAAVRAAGYAYACTTLPGLHRPGDDPLRVARVDVTPQRVSGPGGRYDPLAFRSEVCAWHELWRRGPSGNETSPV